jgi:hypothetical protein
VSLLHNLRNGCRGEKLTGLRRAAFFALLSSCAILQGSKRTAEATKQAADDAKAQADSTGAPVKQARDAQGGGAGEVSGNDRPDEDRLHAQDAPINTAIDDQVDFKRGDKTDWRRVQLLGKPGVAAFELHWDEELANLDLDIYDKFGTLIGKSPPCLEGLKVKKVLVEVAEPGVYYVRVAAPTSHDASIYTLYVKWHGPAAPPSKTAPAPSVVTGAAAAVDANSVYGSVVSLVREGATVTLYLDQGAAAQIRAGMSGTVLDGPEGDKPLAGGAFSITRVIGEAKSMAKSTTLQKPLGHNKRVVIHLQ